MPETFSIHHLSRRQLAIVILALLPPGVIDSERRRQLQRRADRSDWLPADDPDLLGLGQLAGLRVELQPLPGDDADD